MAAGPNRIGWDSNQFEFGEVKASKASGFTLLRCDPSVCYTGSPLPKINLFVTKALQPLGPDSKLLEGNLIDCELQLKLTAPLAPSQTALQPVSCQWEARLRVLSSPSRCLSAHHGGGGGKGCWS